MKIQRQARVKVRLYQKIKLVDGKREKAKVASLYREWLLQRDGGALVIQRYYRAWQTRKRMKNMIYWHRQEMVVLVQSRFRGFRARKRFKRTIKKLRYDRRLSISLYRTPLMLFTPLLNFVSS